MGIDQSTHLADLEARRGALEGERARLQSAIREASNRQSLGVAAESRLGMHIPAANQVVILERGQVQ
jgi:hypothetical protein